MTRLGDVLRSAREAAGLTREAMSWLLGVADAGALEVEMEMERAARGAFAELWTGEVMRVLG